MISWRHGSSPTKSPTGLFKHDIADVLPSYYSPSAPSDTTSFPFERSNPASAGRRMPLSRAQLQLRCAWLRRDTHTAASTHRLFFMVISHLPEGSPAEPATRASGAEPRQPCETAGNKGTSSCPAGGGTASCHAVNVSLVSLKVCHLLGSYKYIHRGDHSTREIEMQFSNYALITPYLTGDSKTRHIHAFRPYHSIYSDANLPSHVRCFNYICINIPISQYDSAYWQHVLLLRLHSNLIYNHSLYWFPSIDKIVPLRQQFFIFNLFLEVGGFFVGGAILGLFFFFSFKFITEILKL